MYELPQPYEKTNGCTLLAVIPELGDDRFVVVVCYRTSTKNYVVATSRLPLQDQWAQGYYDIPSYEEALKVALIRARVL